MPKTEDNILDIANKITGSAGDRTKAYGSAKAEAEIMTSCIKALFGIELTAEQWYIILLLMKIRRQVNKAQRDNLTDIAGYARVLEILFAEQGVEGYVNR